MQNIMWHIQTALDTMWDNMEEAREWIEKAHMYRDECPEYAHWCKMMAAGHMGFLEGGKPYLAKSRDILKATPEYSAHIGGINLMLDHQLAKIAKHGAEINAMIAAYK